MKLGLVSRPRHAISNNFISTNSIFIYVVVIALQTHQKRSIWDPWQATSCSQVVPKMYELPCFFISRSWRSYNVQMHGTDIFRHRVGSTGFSPCFSYPNCTQMHQKIRQEPNMFPLPVAFTVIYHQILLETSGNHQSPNCTHCSMQRFQCLQIIGLQCCITSAWRLRSTGCCCFQNKWIFQEKYVFVNVFMYLYWRISTNRSSNKSSNQSINPLDALDAFGLTWHTYTSTPADH